MIEARTGSLHVLLVDGEPGDDAALPERLEAVGLAVRVTIVPRLAHALAVMRTGPVDCIVTELELPDAHGSAVIRGLQAVGRGVPIVVRTGRGSEEAAVTSFKLGVADYLRKCAGDDGLVRVVREVLGRAMLVGAHLDPMTPAVSARRFGGREFVAEAETTRRLLAHAERASETRAPVLLEGETGTGKDVLARAIHARSAQREGPFVVQNCAALSEALLESELFGHVRGAFTGADRDRPGLFLEAGSGTVFLDEIGDAPPGVQVKLLGVLQDGEVKAVGADRPQRAHARIIAATNRVLHDDVATGRFRADLYYRLAVLPIEVPPLRHRLADVPALLERFLARFAGVERRSAGAVGRDALAALCDYPWPGNIRELEHEAHRLVLTVPAGETIRRRHLAARIRSHGNPWRGEPLEQILERVELAVIRDRLAACPTKAAAARSLGITREGLYGKLRRLDVGTRRESP